MDKKQYMKEYVQKNREKIKEQRREYYKKNKERILELKRSSYNFDKTKNYRLQKNYGISMEEYNKMRERQGYKCAVCAVHEEDLPKANNQHGSKSLVVDHCHVTGSVRQLLCNRCNTVLGLIEENTELLDYLEGYIEYWHRKTKRTEGNSRIDTGVPDATETCGTD
jgi:hypothetical protein